eukprot:2026943-Amphidinium_carterae.2
MQLGTTKHQFTQSATQSDAEDTIKSSTQPKITTRQPQLSHQAKQESRSLLRETAITRDDTKELHQVPSYEWLQHSYTKDEMAQTGGWPGSMTSTRSTTSTT